MPVAGVATVCLAATAAGAGTHAQAGQAATAVTYAQAWLNRQLTPDQRASALLAQMTLAQKLQLVDGTGFALGGGVDYAGHIQGIPALGTEPSAGKRFRSQALQTGGIQMAAAVASQVWGDLGNGLAFDAPECWTIDGGVANYLYAGYEPPLAVWDTFNGHDPFFPPVVR